MWTLTLIKGLRSEPESQNLLKSLHNLADDYEKEGKQDAALRILATIREMRGEIYDAEYQNRVGNVKYHFNDYRGAADAYMKAITVKPMDAEYHSNLSLAYEKMKILDSSDNELENAIQALQRAHELDPDNTDYSARLDGLGFKKIIISETLDKKLDYSNSLPPVRDCGIEGSTVGFAVAYALEYQILKKLNKKVIISPRYIYYYAKLQGGLNPHADTGAFIKDAIKVISIKGAVEESVWPYKPGDLQSDPPEVIESAEHYKIRASYPLNTLYEIKASLKIHGPVTAGVSLFSSVYGVKLAETGKIPLPKASEKSIGAIALCIVGYDDEKQVLKFKNHWGERWGENGYGYLPYEYVVPELLSDAWAISMENKQYKTKE